MQEWHFCFCFWFVWNIENLSLLTFCAGGEGWRYKQGFKVEIGGWFSGGWRTKRG